MKISFLIRLIIVSIVFCLITGNTCVTPYAMQETVKIYVSQTGNDENEGTITSPVKTLEKARLLSRFYCGSTGVEVIIREGIYELERSFVLNSLDCGLSAEQMLVYKAFDGEKVVLTGSKAMDSSVMYKVTENDILKRIIDENARDNLYVIDTRALGIDLNLERKIGSDTLTGVDYGSVNPIIVIDGKMGSVARFPDRYRLDIQSVNETTSDGNSFNLYTDRAKHWNNNGSIYVYGQWKYGWTDQSLTVKSIGEGFKTIETVEAAKKTPTAGSASIYFYNILEEISEPGEYYADVENGKIYFYSDSIDDIRLITLDAPLINIVDAENIRIEGITISGSRGKGVVISDSENVAFKNCTIENIAKGAGDVLSGCTSSGFDGCTVRNVFRGIQISGGEKETLIPGNNFVKNCLIENFGGECYARGISLAGVGNLVSRCTIRNSNHLAIQISGNNNVVENCDISNVLKHSGDMGAIYMDTGWTGRGNIIRNNYFHDISSENDFALGTRAIYLDKYTSGTTIYGNLFGNIDDACIVIANGRDNSVTNNIFVSTLVPFYISQVDKETDYTTLSVYKSLINSPYQNDVWKDEYKQLYSIMDNNTPHYAEGNSMKNNIYIDSAKVHTLSNITAEEIGGYENNLYTNSMNVFKLGYEEKIFELSDNSLLTDYKVIDLSECGGDGAK